MPGVYTTDPKIRYQNILDNPHIVDWYFSYRLNEFLKVVFDGILECEWRWHRYEWQSRSSIHAHGAAKFKNDPGLLKLTNNIYIGRQADLQLNNQDNTIEEIKKLEELSLLGTQSESTVITYTDTLLTAVNPREKTKNTIDTTGPHPCSIDTTGMSDDQLNEDYSEIINVCQRHTCRVEGYCKSTKGGCRFGYPLNVSNKTTIEFTMGKNGNIKAEIHVKRNDPMMNIHSRIVAHNWRGNVDMQIILDQQAAVNYMVKYITKGEKAGNGLSELYKSVILHTSDDDNPKSKLKSLMLKTVSGKRDLGQCEVCRLLMSEPLYSSSFEFITISLELKQSREVVSGISRDDITATYQSLMDHYAQRFTNLKLEPVLSQITNYYSFSKMFKSAKGKYI